MHFSILHVSKNSEDITLNKAAPSSWSAHLGYSLKRHLFILAWYQGMGLNKIVLMIFI